MFEKLVQLGTFLKSWYILKVGTIRYTFEKLVCLKVGTIRYTFENLVHFKVGTIRYTLEKLVHLKSWYN